MNKDDFSLTMLFTIVGAVAGAMISGSASSDPRIFVEYVTIGATSAALITPVGCLLHQAVCRLA